MSCISTSPRLMPAALTRVTPVPFKPPRSRRQVSTCALQGQIGCAEKVLSSVAAASIAIAMTAGSASANVQDLPLILGRPLNEIASMASFSLPPLPYDYTALEPYIDGTTMNIHHTKHHQTYVTNVNGALEKHPELKDLDLVALNKAVGTDKIPADVATVVRNNGGGHFNHSFFWNILGAPGSSNGPSSDLKAAIDERFGSLDELKKQFNAAAASRFGSGWAWLSVDKDGKLVISSTPNQDNTLFANADTPSIPILGLDVWEHAYYLKYQNRRPEYISAFWNVVNWDTVNNYYADAKSGTIPKL